MKYQIWWNGGNDTNIWPRVDIWRLSTLGWTSKFAFNLPFHSQDLISNSPKWLLYNSYDSRSEKLLLDQLKIPNWYFSLFSSLACSILYRYCKEKFFLGHSWELKGQKDFFLLVLKIYGQMIQPLNCILYFDTTF